MRKTRLNDSVKRTKFIRQCGMLRDPITAAKEAGYKNPFDAAKRLMANSFVCEQVKAIQAKVASNISVDAAYIVEKAKRIVEYGMQEVETREILVDGSGKAYKLMNPKIALGGLELLGNICGLFKDKVEVSGTINIEALKEARQRVMDMGCVSEGTTWEITDGSGGEAAVSE